MAIKLRRIMEKTTNKNKPSNKSSLNTLIFSSVSLVIGFIFGIGFIFSYGSYFGVYTNSDNSFSSNISATYNELRNNFEGEIDKEKLIEGANKGLVNALGDQYTQYLSKSDANDFQKDLNGDVGAGIGVELGLRNDRVTVLRTLAGNPAVKAGILAGDYLVLVDDADVTKSNASETAKKIRGESGTTVRVVVERNNQLFSYNLKREKINDLSVDYYLKDSVGILRILRFDDNTSELARKAVQDFKSKNVKGIVIDLRNNGGGYVSAAKEVASIWLEDKVVMTEKRNNKIVDTIRTSGKPIVPGIKTVIILNGSSASASEILAGAFKDYKIATIIGEKSFGKGSVQKLVDLSDGAQLKVTIAKWFTPNNKNINGEGIEPDKVVLYSSENINKGIDDQLNAAISEIIK